MLQPDSIIYPSLLEGMPSSDDVIVKSD